MNLNDMIKELGLSEYEKKAYLALLQLGRSKSKAVSRHSKVSYGRIYEILEKLEQKGLIMIQPTKPKTFQALDPKTAFSRIIAKRHERLDDMKKSLDEIKIPMAIPLSVEDKTEILHGKEKQISIIKELHNKAEKEILLIPGVYQPGIPRHIVTLRALKKGIKIRLIVRQVTKKNRKMIEEGKALGEEVRLNEFHGLRMIIMDSKEAMISIVDENTGQRISIHTTNEDFSASMASFFDVLWKKSKKFS